MRYGPKNSRSGLLETKRHPPDAASARRRPLNGTEQATAGPGMQASGSILGTISGRRAASLHALDAAAILRNLPRRRQVLTARGVAQLIYASRGRRKGRRLSSQAGSLAELVAAALRSAPELESPLSQQAARASSTRPRARRQQWGSLLGRMLRRRICARHWPLRVPARRPRELVSSHSFMRPCSSRPLSARSALGRFAGAKQPPSIGPPPAPPPALPSPAVLGATSASEWHVVAASRDAMRALARSLAARRRPPPHSRRRNARLSAADTTLDAANSR